MADAEMMRSEEERAKTLKRRSLLHQGLLRNQKHIPAFDSKLATLAFLDEVYKGSVFHWQMEEVRILNCATVPSLLDLTRTLNVALMKVLQPLYFHVLPDRPEIRSKITRLLEHLRTH